MKKRVLSIILLLTLLLTALPVQAEAASARLPIYTGDLQVDYMAEVLLSQMDLQGKSDLEKIGTVYDWIILHCTRQPEEWDGTYYFDEAEVAAMSSGQFAASYRRALDEGRILLRQEYRTEYGLPNYGADYWDSDANYYVISCAREMMLKRNGHCGNFSSLLAVLLGHLGYDTRLVYGDFVSKFGGAPVVHTWNYILLDGTYYWADVRIDHSNYTSGYGLGHNYFMIESKDEWMVEHVWEDTYSDWLAEHASALQSILDDAAALAPEVSYTCSDWAKDYMAAAAEQQLIPDTLADQDLTQNISRAEFAAVAVQLYEALGCTAPDYVGETPFLDTRDPYVLQAYGMGVVNGMGDGIFAPDSALTREQAVTMLGRVCELAWSGAVGSGSWLPQGQLLFTDSWNIFDYARNYVGFFVGQGIVDGMGDGTFSPKNSMTREQALKIAVVTADSFGY